MKLKITQTFILGSMFLLATPFASASMLGLCNDAKQTQYICCPSQGGWIVSSDCDQGAATHCQNDVGIIAGSNPPTSILNDCKNRGGSSVQYWLSAMKNTSFTKVE